MKKIFAELNAFRPELLCVLVSVAAGVGATLGLPTYLSDIINRGIADKDMNYILHTGVIMLGIAILGMVCYITTGFFASRIALGLGRNVRSRIFTKVEYFSQAEIDTFSTASLITRTNNDITQVQNFMVMFLPARYSDSAYHVRGGHHAGLQQKSENVKHTCGVHAGDGADYQPDWQESHAAFQKDADKN